MESTQPKRFRFWNPTKTMIFLREYLHHEVLWKTDHPLYYVPAAKENAYTAVCRSFGKPMLSRRMVLDRITYLRRRYNNHRKQLATNPQLSSQDWYRLMDASFAPQMRDSNPPISQPARTAPPSTCRDNGATAAVNNDNSNHSSLIGGQMPHSSTVEHQQDSAVSATSSRADRITRQLDVLQQLDRNVQKSMQELRTLAHEEATAAVRGIGTSANETLLDRNEFDVFGRNVASQLERLPIDAAINCQHVIQSVLRDFRLRQHMLSTTATLGTPMATDYGQSGYQQQDAMQQLQSQQLQSQQQQQQQQQNGESMQFTNDDDDIEQQIQSSVHVECQPSMFADNSMYDSRESSSIMAERTSTPQQRHHDMQPADNVAGRSDADGTFERSKKKRKKSKKRIAEIGGVVSAFVDIVDSDD